MKLSEQVEYNKFANDFIREVEAWVQAEIYPKFSLSGGRTLDWGAKRRCSRGGYYADGPGINIAMKWCIDKAEGEIKRVYEYKSFDSDPFIGGIYTRNKYDKLRLTILHEIGHALQYYSYRLNGFRGKPHGTTWKNFYRRLREQFLNHQLEDQAALKQEYESGIDDILGKNNKTLYKRAASI